MPAIASQPASRPLYVPPFAGTDAVQQEEEALEAKTTLLFDFER